MKIGPGIRGGLSLLPEDANKYFATKRFKLKNPLEELPLAQPGAKYLDDSMEAVRARAALARSMDPTPTSLGSDTPLSKPIPKKLTEEEKRNTVH